MGHKVSPLVLRIGFIKTWTSQWYANKREFPALILEDLKIRAHVKKNFEQAAIAKVEVRRTASKVQVAIHTARPGVIIGRRGAEIDRLREELSKLTGKELVIDIKEIKNPATEAQLVSENIAFQLRKRIAFRRAMKKAIQQTMAAGALGVRVKCAGRLGGSEMKRRESYREGKIPLQTLRADIDYGFAEAFTTYGMIGVKVWIYKGDILPEKDRRPVEVAHGAVS